MGRGDPLSRQVRPEIFVLGFSRMNCIMGFRPYLDNGFLCTIKKKSFLLVPDAILYFSLIIEIKRVK